MRLAVSSPFTCTILSFLARIMDVLVVLGVLGPRLGSFQWAPNPDLKSSPCCGACVVCARARARTYVCFAVFPIVIASYTIQRLECVPLASFYGGGDSQSEPHGLSLYQ
jgi:hypothetical protein